VGVKGLTVLWCRLQSVLPNRFINPQLDTNRSRKTKGLRGHRGYCIARRRPILSILTCSPLIKTFCILLSKLRSRLFTIFTAYIVSVFLACFYNGCACDRFLAWSCPLKRAVYSAPDSQCLECYTYRLSTLDTMQKIQECGSGSWYK